MTFIRNCIAGLPAKMNKAIENVNNSLRQNDGKSWEDDLKEEDINEYDSLSNICESEELSDGIETEVNSN